MIIRDNYTTITSREELKRAVELGLKVYLSAKENRPDFGYIEPLVDVTRYFPGAPGHFDMFHWRAIGEHDLSPAEEPRPFENDLRPAY